jgi:Arc/MetJ-type ribon-helix-helix transcriptional regulator
MIPRVLTTREAASLILISLLVVTVVVLPSWRRRMSPLLRSLVEAAAAPRLLVVYGVVVIACSAATALAWWLGLWDTSMVKDAVIITATVVLPMTFRSFTFSSGGGLVRHLIRETLGLSTLLVFYLDARPLPILGEIGMQVFTTFLVMLQAAARTRDDVAPVKRLIDVMLVFVGAGLLLWSSVALFSSPTDWWEQLRSLLFSFWLPLTLLPFFYAFGFYAVAEQVQSRFRAIRRPFRPRLFVAFIIGTRLRLSLLAAFTGRYNSVSEASGFRDGLRRMRAFRQDLKQREEAERSRLATLEDRAGRSGCDLAGQHLDRREFDATKHGLDRIWGVQNGQWDRLGGRYWDDLLDAIVDAERLGLPKQHGITVQIAERGQVWRAWRRTPGGAVLGVGGREHRSKYYFQGEREPTGWPGSSDEWCDTAREAWPPDWDVDDGSRL